MGNGSCCTTLSPQRCLCERHQDARLVHLLDQTSTSPFPLGISSMHQHIVIGDSITFPSNPKETSSRRPHQQRGQVSSALLTSCRSWPSFQHNHVVSRRHSHPRPRPHGHGGGVCAQERHPPESGGGGPASSTMVHPPPRKPWTPHPNHAIACATPPLARVVRRGLRPHAPRWLGPASDNTPGLRHSGRAAVRRVTACDDGAAPQQSGGARPSSPSPQTAHVTWRYRLQNIFRPKTSFCRLSIWSTTTVTGILHSLHHTLA